MRRTVNIVNFIRGCEPRCEDDSFLTQTTMNQIRLVKEFGFSATWLVQHDAMDRPALVEFMKRELDASQEVGVWLEIVQGLVERAGLKWRGRHPWDWHPNVGFSIGYVPAERERLIDVLMVDFKECWGYYPASVGSWFIDAHTLAYLHGKYGIVASCNCREQFGTDGYGLWGGYWSGAYFPSRKNSLLPGQTEGGQIPVPVFRMLGADPIYQYASEIKAENFYEGYGHHGRTQDIITLELAKYHPDCGGSNPEWVTWFLRYNFAEPSLSLAYAQAGQENSMGWEGMRQGLQEQFRQLKTLRVDGFLAIETLAESGRAFSREFKVSPPTAVCALDDWKGEGRAALWYMSRFQRLGFLVEDGRLHLRDWQLYDENYPEPFLNSTCDETSCLYDALPVMDGFRWRKSRDTMSALNAPFRPARLPPSIGFRLEGGKGRIAKVTEAAGKELSIVWEDEAGSTLITCGEREVRFEFPDEPHTVKMFCDDAETAGTRLRFGPAGLHYEHNGFAYLLEAVIGTFDPASRAFVPADNVLALAARVVDIPLCCEIE